MQAQIVDATVTQNSGAREPTYFVKFASSSQTVSESSTLATIALTVGEPALRDLAVSYTISGTAGDSDHLLMSGTVYINAGESNGVISIQLLDDNLDEDDETIIVTLTQNSEIHVVTIEDNDGRPTITIGNGSGFEGSTVDFPVTLSSASGRDVSFTYEIVNGTTTAADFSGALAGTFTVPAGLTSTTLSIPTVQDNALDGQENFTVMTSGPVNADSVNSPVSGTLNELVVETMYPVNGANWNDYVVAGWDLPCTETSVPSGFNPLPNYLLDWNCPNGGSQKRVRVPAYSECGNLIMSDSLGVFNWVCKVVSGKVEFQIINFNLGKGLKNLVTEAGFNPIRVQLKDGGGPVIMESAALNGWWSNPVLSLPNNAGGAVAVLNTPGAIYVEDASKNVRGYNITAPKISVVSGPGVILILENSTPNNCDTSLGGTAGADYPAMICFGSTQKAWIELNVQLSAVFQLGIYIVDSFFTRVHGTTIKGDSNDLLLTSDSDSPYLHISQVRISGGSTGIASSNYNTIIEDTVVDGVGSYGIVQTGGDNIRLSRVRTFNNAGDGIKIFLSPENVVLADIVSANNGGYGIYIKGQDVTLVNVLVANNVGYGVGADSAGFGYNLHMVNVTAVNNSNTGLKPSNYYNVAFTDYTSLINSVAGNNTTGLGVGESSSTAALLFENLYLGNNGTAISLTDVSQVIFQGLLNIGGNASGCAIVPYGTTPEVGITNTTCALVSPSTGTLNTTLNMSASFVGKAGTDSVNTTIGANSNTAIAVGSITDQVNFQHQYRVWGKNGSAYPNSDHRGRCTSGTCNIWDFSLAPGDTALRNVNGVFVDGANCPASVHGDNFLIGYNSTFYASAYLKYATEVLLDGIGDDDGLCESQESCVFSPHAGAYQGDPNGNYLAHSCNFQDGAIMGVKMYRRPEL